MQHSRDINIPPVGLVTRELSSHSQGLAESKQWYDFSRKDRVKFRRHVS